MKQANQDSFLQIILKDHWNGNAGPHIGMLLFTGCLKKVPPFDYFGSRQPSILKIMVYALNKVLVLMSPDVAKQSNS